MPSAGLRVKFSPNLYVFKVTVAGYSKRSLVQKLGIKPGDKICIIHPPDRYDQTLGQLPPAATAVELSAGELNFVQFFTASRAELAAEFDRLKQAITPNGMVWISWPKKASKMPTDLTEDVVRDIGLRRGLVDVKVCAVDDIWSGLKFVYRLEDRP